MSPSEASAPTVVADSYLTLHYRLSIAPGETSMSGPGDAIAGGRPVAMPNDQADDADGAKDALPGGDVVSTFGAQPATLQLGAGQLSPALEERLLGLPMGAHRVFRLDAGEAFGPRNPELVQRLPRKVLEAESDKTDYRSGDVVEFNAPGGGRYAGVFRSLDNDYATFDFNHPLAGQPVCFEVRIVGIL